MDIYKDKYGYNKITVDIFAGYLLWDTINRYQKEIKHEYYQAWQPASAGMTDRDLAWSQFRRNYDPITLKLVGVLNHWHAILCYIFFFRVQFISEFECRQWSLISGSGSL